MTSTTPETYVIHPDIVYTLVDSEAVIMGQKQKNLYGLNETGTEMLLYFESKPLTLQSVHEYLITHFEVEEDQSRLDAQTFIEALLAESIIMPVG